jgi:hypothetical protein
MAYLTCPFCPAQAVPAQRGGIILDLYVMEFVCNSHHTFYVKEKDVYGDNQRITTEESK